MLSEEEGEFLIKLARKSIEEYVKNGKKIDPPKELPKSLTEKRGVFVTLKKNGELRGCIGYPEPIKPLAEATIDSAISSATSDPRFPPLKPAELKEISIEVSVLTKPKLVEVENPQEYLKKIKIGKDGIIVEKGFNKGLLLPQVPVEQNWDVEEFLCNACMKAGLPPDCWFDSETRIYKFQAQIFEEK
ncbi:AMMECR1 domain protein [Methanothermus fervidus DSM 2088]|uniref:Protein Mfer_1263 n=1 Tax=Methanothermus fervidus (strain ATCC 43054 / DSM 2088 / JCM 10308 / V24 S) TaxID=523846 RepID=E3GX54_METFV|nr:TIGR00296 family protein [Methanothermus fervidus]ADP78049.1 AMMECR1 domain protein [Methanothermus fervidus DSM 2088]